MSYFILTGKNIEYLYVNMCYHENIVNYMLLFLCLYNFDILKCAKCHFKVVTFDNLTVKTHQCI